jgi:prophage regulatory protein
VGQTKGRWVVELQRKLYVVCSISLNLQNHMENMPLTHPEETYELRAGDVGQTSIRSRTQAPISVKQRSTEAQLLPAAGASPAINASLLRCPAVLKRTAMGRTALYALIKAGKFPAPVKVGGASAWVDVEISRWIEGLMLAREAKPCLLHRRDRASSDTGCNLAAV